MKYVILLVVVLVVLGIWRKRRDQAPGTPSARRPTPEPQAMLACAHCGVHVPQKDAVIAQGEAFCSEAHRILGPTR